MVETSMQNTGIVPESTEDYAQRAFTAFSESNFTEALKHLDHLKGKPESKDSRI